MTILFDSTVARKSAPRTFGPEPRRPFVPSLADLDWAAQSFGDAESDRENARLEEQAEQARWDDQFRFPAGICESCGEKSDWLDPTHKLCDACLDAATDATISCLNRNAMGQYRVF
jgi:hypothetical protein